MNAPPLSPGAGLRVLLVRLSSIGDVVHGLPVLCELRRSLPAVYTAWVVEDWAAGPLEGHPALDKLIRIPRRCFEDAWRRPLRLVSTLRRLRKQLEEHCFDVVIDLQGLTKSALVARLSGARRRLGFAGVDGRQQSQWFNNHLVEPKSSHVVDRNLELLQPLGIAVPAPEFGLPVNSAAAERMRGCLSGLGVSPRAFALMTPGSGRAEKRWPPGRFAALAAELGRACDLPTVVVWAGEREKKWARHIADASHGFAHVAPGTTIAELAELAREARIFVGADTGPLHVAAAVATPCVGLYGPMPGRRNGPFGSGHTVIQAEGSSACRPTASRGDSLMRAITVEQALQACRSLLSSP